MTPSSLARRGFDSACLVLLSSFVLGASSPAAVPPLFWWRAEDLVGARTALQTQADAPHPALAAVLAEADEWLTRRPPSVLDKTRIAASGDRHDYLSFGPYWWPDPTQPDGLPYIRRDGEINQEMRTGSDDSAWERMSAAVEDLALAYWFTGKPHFAKGAAEYVRVWFLDPATRMNPNFQHAQSIPGLSTGRGIGLIEARILMRVNESLALLEGSAAWPDSLRLAYRAWLTEFFTWMRTSQNGRDAAAEPNNHGSWYDAQCAHLALVLGDKATARRILEAGPNQRIATQIEPSGAQPHEMERANSLGYSIFNLEALFVCARLADHPEFEGALNWWAFEPPEGRSLRQALRYLAPYADPMLPWKKADLADDDRPLLIPLLDEFLRHQSDPALRQTLEEFEDQSGPAQRWRLLNHRLGR
jgi:hypothetical protein